MILVRHKITNENDSPYQHNEKLTNIIKIYRGKISNLTGAEAVVLPTNASFTGKSSVFIKHLLLEIKTIIFL